MSTPRPGRPPVPIERDPQRFEIAAWWAFVGMGYGQFDAARRALLTVKGGPITLSDIEGVLIRASTKISLPQPHDPFDKDKGLRRLAAKAQRAAGKRSQWLIVSSGLIRAAIGFIAENNTTGTSVAFDGLLKLGWGEVLLGLADRIEAALKSNLPPDDLEKLTPAARKLLAELRGQRK